MRGARWTRASGVMLQLGRARADWRGLGPCRDEDPDLFYECQSASQVKRAKGVCAGCPVIRECLGAAMTEEAAIGGPPGRNRKHRFGVRGGLTATERWELAYPREAKREREKAARKKAVRTAALTTSAPLDELQDFLLT